LTRPPASISQALWVRTQRTARVQLEFPGRPAYGLGGAAKGRAPPAHAERSIAHGNCLCADILDTHARPSRFVHPTNRVGSQAKFVCALIPLIAPPIRGGPATHQNSTPTHRNCGVRYQPVFAQLPVPSGSPYLSLMGRSLWVTLVVSFSPYTGDEYARRRGSSVTVITCHLCCAGHLCCAEITCHSRLRPGPFRLPPHRG